MKRVVAGLDQVAHSTDGRTRTELCSFPFCVVVVMFCCASQMVNVAAAAVLCVCVCVQHISISSPVVTVTLHSTRHTAAATHWKLNSRWWLFAYEYRQRRRRWRGERKRGVVLLCTCVYYLPTAAIVVHNRMHNTRREYKRTIPNDEREGEGKKGSVGRSALFCPCHFIPLLFLSLSFLTLIKKPPFFRQAIFIQVLCDGAFIILRAGDALPCACCCCCWYCCTEWISIVYHRPPTYHLPADVSSSHRAAHNSWFSSALYYTVLYM